MDWKKNLYRKTNKRSNIRLAYAEKLRRNPTFSESKFIEFLNKNNINHKFNELIKRWIVDFYIPEKHLIIEIDGGYHNTKFVKNKDLTRDSFFWRQGFKVVRFKNEELENEELIKDRLSSYIHI